MGSGAAIHCVFLAPGTRHSIKAKTTLPTSDALIISGPWPPLRDSPQPTCPRSIPHRIRVSLEWVREIRGEAAFVEYYALKEPPPGLSKETPLGNVDKLRVRAGCFRQSQKFEPFPDIDLQAFDIIC